jgi:hypothetical protein
MGQGSLLARIQSTGVVAWRQSPPPSSGRPQAGFAHLRPPLILNVLLQNPVSGALRRIGLVFLGVALMFSRPSAIFMLPQWVLLMPVGILGWMGARRQTARVAGS